MNLLGVKKAQTTAYHQQSNGMVERFHRQLKADLKLTILFHGWIPTTSTIGNTYSNEGCTTAEMVYGTTLRLPSESYTQFHTY